MDKRYKAILQRTYFPSRHVELRNTAMNKSIFFNTFIVGLFWSINDDLKKNNVVFYRQTSTEFPSSTFCQFTVFFGFFPFFFFPYVTSKAQEYNTA